MRHAALNATTVRIVFDEAFFSKLQGRPSFGKKAVPENVLMIRAIAHRPTFSTDPDVSHKHGHQKTRPAF